MTSLEPYAGSLYCALVWIAYIPGLLALFFYKKVWHFPLLTFTFIGMFLFTCAGSINIFNLDTVYWVHFDKKAVFADYAALLIAQVSLFYLCCAYYIFKKTITLQKIEVGLFDNLFIFVGLGLILILSICYYSETKTFLIFQAIAGDLNIHSAYDIRMKYIYGLKNWPFYNIGFSVFPTFISSLALLRSLVLKKIDTIFYISMVICFAASLSMGSKVGLLAYVLTFSLAITIYNSQNEISIFQIFKSKKFILFVCLVLVFVVFGYYQATPDHMPASIFLKKFWYRLAVSSTESVSAAVSYAKNVGYLGVTVFPNARGFFSHQYANLPLLLNHYISLVPGGVNTPFISEIFLVKGWVSVFTLCPVLFIGLISLQEFLLRLKVNVVSLAFSTYYSYMAILLSTVGLSSTFLTFMYPLAFSILFLLSYGFFLFFRYFNKKRLWAS